MSKDNHEEKDRKEKEFLLSVLKELRSVMRLSPRFVIPRIEYHISNLEWRSDERSSSEPVGT